MGNTATINYALAATLLSQGLNYEQAAQQVGAKNGNSLKVGLSRRGVTLTATRGNDFAIARATLVANKVVNAESERLKGAMAGILEAQTGALAKIKPKTNLRHIQQVGAAIEPLARTAKLVHGWGSEESQGMVKVGWMASADPESQPAIDITCGQDTPIGSGLQSPQIDSTPQVSQVDDSQSNAS